MDDYQNRLTEIAAAVADAREVDWEAELSRSEERDVLKGLYELSRIYRAHCRAEDPGLRPADGSFDLQPRRHPAPERWGPLVIREVLGAGVSGEVYRAHHPELAMDVALKLLRPSGASQEDLQEGRLLARIRHPNVVRVHGAERHDGRTGIWMELVRGRTLAEVVRQSGPLDAREAALVGIDVCRALAALHGAGLLHRDVKAQNVMREEGGRIVLMDLGAGLSGEDSEENAERLAGTPMYMAPEVFAGQRATPAADFYSVGVLLFHLATGSYPFAARSVESLERVRGEGRETLLLDARPGLPEKFVTVVERALDPEPEGRFPSAGAMERELRAVLGEDIAPPKPPPSRIPRWLRLAAAAIGLLAAGWLGSLWRGEADIVRQVIPLPEGVDMRLMGPASALALSPDGKELVYAARDAQGTRLYRHPLDAFGSEPLAGTDGARSPFFSPDGRWVGFAAGYEVKRLSLDSGQIWPLCRVTVAFFGGDWNREQGTVFGDCSRGLLRAVEGRDEPEVVAGPREVGGVEHGYPQLLGDGDTVLFTIWTSENESKVVVRSLATGEQKTVVPQGTLGRYTPSGHLVYGWKGSLMAVPFDVDRLSATGGPVKVVDEVMMSLRGAVHYDVAADGTLAYVPGPSESSHGRLVWIDRSGVREPTLAPTSRFMSPRVSPDGKWIAVVDEAGDVCLIDLERGTHRRLTDERGIEWWLVWSPDSRKVLFNSSLADDTVDLFWKRIDFSRDEQLLLGGPYNLVPQSFLAGGRTLALLVDLPEGPDVFALDLDDEWTVVGEARPLVPGRPRKIHPVFSPDGRWLAYAADASGTFQVYVQPYPGPGEVAQVSVDGGLEPLWAPDGRTLYFRSENGNQVLAASFSPEPLRVGAVRLLFEGRFAEPFLWARNYDLSPDGERFLMIVMPEPPPAPTRIHVVRNWLHELARLVPTT